MADRIFKGRLITTGDIHDENTRAFPEASEDFKKAHKGGLKPFQMLHDIFRNLEEYRVEAAAMGHGIEDHPRVTTINGSLWISDKDAWIKIDPDGSFEIGASGV